MSLRTRLIVAFFLLSVVPLAAVTLYTYTSNVRALHAATQHETQLLTSELTQRMQVVTAQISERVQDLMDMPMTGATGTSGSRPPATQTVARSQTRTTPAAARPPAAPAAPAAPIAVTATAVDPRAIEAQVAGALGEVAMLLNNVEVRGLGRAGGLLRTAPPGAPAAAEEALRARPTTQAFPGRAPQAGERGASPDARESEPAARADAAPDPSGRGRERGRRFRSESRGAPDANPNPNPTPAADPDPNLDPSHIKIDLAPIRRELFRELTSGEAFEQMTPEQRQRIGREVNQRLLGIVQGMKLSAAEVAKKAELAKQQAAEASAAGEAKPSPGARPTPPALPATVSPVPSVAAPGGVPPTPPAAPRARVTERPEPPARAEQPAVPESAAPRATRARPEAPMTKKAALTGTQLNVRVERDGQILQQVNAEINLPNLLATVFANTRRDSGEIPFAVGRDGQLYAPTDADRARLGTLDVAGVDDTPGTKRVGDWVVVTMPDRSGAGLRFGIARPVGNLLSDLRRTTARNAGFGLLFIAVALVGMVPLSGRLTKNLTTLTDGVGRIAHGDYSARVPVKSGDEIGRLAAAFNQMAADVEQHQRSAVEQERIRRELELGRRIQSEMLPHAPLQLGLTEVKGVSVPAREVGGDFFNYFVLDSGLIALLVGDVSGKGVGAALLMANIQASLRTRFALGQELSAIADAIDDDIEANSPGPVYSTLFMAILDPATRRMRYVNAGHHPQFVLRTDGRLEKMSSTGLPVGLLAGHGYKEIEVQLGAGDLLFFYTDGCVEMENDRGEMFGSERLEALVAASSVSSADEVLATVELAIAKFRGGRDLFDDATMMAVRVG
ncbi:MAG TPA: SpoIIE family protein phosphatase [Vicinamibacterales bacterium]|nr:SpoIIE family protein phosphatase [Vicinamibacterales bacterium]